MSARNVLIAIGCLIGLVVILTLPSLAARISAALLIIIVTAVVLTLRRKKIDPQSIDEELHFSDERTAETFAFGKLFEATINGMREGLVVVDKDMRVVASNAAALRLFNPSRTSLDRQRLTELTRNPAIYDAFLDALKGTERSGVKVQTHGPDRLVFDLRVVPLSTSRNDDDSKTPQGALGVFIDVTRIEHLEQVRQEFLSNVSHELRTPLTSILAFVETLEAGAIDDAEASRRFLPIIRRNASRMQDLIDDILELSAIEAGNVQVKVEKIDLSEVVNDVASSLTARAANHNVTITNAVSPDSFVYADARRLEQMLTNLVENAIKFNRPGGEVTIEHEKSAADSNASGPIDRITVSDTGEGIPAQHVDRLFERFYRVDRARSRELGGTGLGLAIVKHLALAHGGEIRVTSELGKGTTFAIELPGDPLKHTNGSS